MPQQHIGVRQLPGSLFIPMSKNQADKTQRNSGRGTESTSKISKPRKQETKFKKRGITQTGNARTLLTTKKNPDKLATRGMKAWLIYTSGQGNNKKQVRHVREIAEDGKKNNWRK